MSLLFYRLKNWLVFMVNIKGVSFLLVVILVLKVFLRSFLRCIFDHLQLHEYLS